jgi:hypothetical protein
MTYNPTLEQVIEIANDRGLEAADQVTRESNGSEAWQAVQFKTKGNRKLQNQLKKLEGVERDSYWGYLISAPFDHYYKEEAYNDAFVKVLGEHEIAAVKVERLL